MSIVTLARDLVETINTIGAVEIESPRGLPAQYRPHYVASLPATEPQLFVLPGLAETDDEYADQCDVPIRYVIYVIFQERLEIVGDTDVELVVDEFNELIEFSERLFRWLSNIPPNDGMNKPFAIEFDNRRPTIHEWPVAIVDRVYVSAIRCTYREVI